MENKQLVCCMLLLFWCWMIPVCICQVDQCNTNITACKYFLEAENGYSTVDLLPCPENVDKPSFACIHSRKSASNKSVVRFINLRENVRFRFKLNSTCFFRIMDTMYSNDGEGDTITIDINGRGIGTFNSIRRTENGTFWDRFSRSGQIGKAHVLYPEVSNLLTLSLLHSSDVYGLELDGLLVKFLCNGKCPQVFPTQPQRIFRQIDNNNGEKEKVLKVVRIVGGIAIAFSSFSCLLNLSMSVYNVYQAYKMSKQSTHGAQQGTSSEKQVKEEEKEQQVSKL